MSRVIVCQSCGSLALTFTASDVQDCDDCRDWAAQDQEELARELGAALALTPEEAAQLAEEQALRQEEEREWNRMVGESLTPSIDYW